MTMNRSTKRFLKNSNIIPISLFVSENEDTLERELIGIMTYYNERYLFYSTGASNIHYEFSETQTVVLPMEQFELDVPKNSIFVGYNMKSDIDFIENLFPNGTVYDLLQEVSQSYSDYTQTGPRRFTLFNLAFWNRCSSTYNFGPEFFSNTIKLLLDWERGLERKVIKKFHITVVWIAELANYITKKSNIRVRSHTDNEKIYIPMRRIIGTMQEEE
jgi:hypothetical protein